MAPCGAAEPVNRLRRFPRHLRPAAPVLKRAAVIAEPNGAVFASGLTNGRGAIVTLTLNGAFLDSFDTGSIAGGTTERASLAGGAVVSAGLQEVRILMTREFTTSNVLGVTPFQFLDNIVATFEGDQVSEVPEPGSLALFGAGLLELAWYRRRKTV